MLTHFGDPSVCGLALAGSRTTSDLTRYDCPACRIVLEKHTQGLVNSSHHIQVENEELSIVMHRKGDEISFTLMSNGSAVTTGAMSLMMAESVGRFILEKAVFTSRKDNV